MVAAVRLLDGRAELFQGSVGVGKGARAWADKEGEEGWKEGRGLTEGLDETCTKLAPPDGMGRPAPGYCAWGGLRAPAQRHGDEIAFLHAPDEHVGTAEAGLTIARTRTDLAGPISH